jgi:hypothetical protein
MRVAWLLGCYGHQGRTAHPQCATHSCSWAVGRLSTRTWRNSCSLQQQAAISLQQKQPWDAAPGRRVKGGHHAQGPGRCMCNGKQQVIAALQCAPHGPEAPQAACTCAQNTPHLLHAALWYACCTPKAQGQATGGAGHPVDCMWWTILRGFVWRPCSRASLALRIRVCLSVNRPDITFPPFRIT